MIGLLYFYKNFKKLNKDIYKYVYIDVDPFIKKSINEIMGDLPITIS